MKNQYFTDTILPVLLDIRRWRLVSARLTEERPVTSPRHRRWMSVHQHAHVYPEVMIALRGHTVYGIHQRIYPCVPGTVFVFDPAVPHDLGYPPWTPAITHLWISLVQDKAMARLQTVHQGRIRTQSKLHCLLDLEDTALRRQGTPGAFLSERPPALSRLRLLAALANLTAALVEEGYQDVASDQCQRFQREKIEAICRHIRDTGGADASLDHLAEIAGYSTFHFLRLFQRHTGRTIHDYVNQSRLRKIEILRGRGTAFKAIAAELGFSGPAAFSRWYRPFRK